MGKLINLEPQKEEKLNFRQFLEVYKNQKEEIEKIHIIPPTLGQSGFGYVVIVWKTPTYKIRKNV